MDLGSSFSSCLRMPHLCEPGTPRRQPCVRPQLESASPPSTTGCAAPYAESWCQPAKVSPSAFFTRQAMDQQRRFGPTRSSKMSRMRGSSAISSTHGASRCDLVFIFLMSGTRASSASNFSRKWRARSALIARTGERQPSRWYRSTWASVRTLGMWRASSSDAPGAAVDAGDAGADGRRHVVEAEAVVGGDLGGGDLEIALAADDDDLVADRGVRNRGEIEAGVLEGRRADQGNRAAPHQHAAGVEPAQPVRGAH